MKLIGQLQAASVRDVEDRTRRYVLLPYDGTPGFTNMGRVVASKGRLRLPDDPSTFVLNIEHDGTRPVAKGTEIVETDAALMLAVRALATTAGNDYLVECDERVRTGVSVEVDDPVVREGKLLGGYLSGGGACVEPAFDTARLVASKAVVPDEGDPATVPAPDEDQDDEDTTTADADEEEHEDEKEVGDVPENEQEETAPARAPKLAATKQKMTRTIGATDAYQLLAAVRTGDQTAMAELEPAGRLFGALAVISAADGTVAGQPAWLGEIWSGKTFERRVIPLLTQAPLTGLKVQGFRWTAKPEVAKFAGVPAEIHSAPVALAPVTDDAQRWAGGNRLDRAYIDFNDSVVISAYLAALADSYAEETDAEALATLVATATPVTAGAGVAGVSDGLVAIVDGALAVVSMGQPGFAIVATDVWRDIMLGKSIDALAFIASNLNLEEGQIAGFRIVPHADMTAGSVLVGVKAAATHYELPGSPLRVNAQAVAVGAIDEAVFGYDLTMVNDARGLALVG